MTIKFALFIIMIIGILASQWIVSSESLGMTGAVVQETSGMPGVTGLVTETLTPNTNINITLAVLFLIISVYLVYRSQEKRYLMKLEKDLTDYGRYAAFIIRLVLGTVFVWQAFNITIYNGELLTGILYIIVGIFLILGLFTRISAYVSIFLLLKQLFMGINPLFFIVLMANAILVLLLGSGAPSFDEDVRKNKTNAQ